MSQRRWIITWGAFISMGFLGMSRSFLGTALPEIRATLDLTLVQAGTLTALLQLGFSVTVLLGGPISDTLKKSLVLMLGLFLLGGSLIFFGLAHWFWVSLLAIIVVGMGGGLIEASSNPLLIELYPGRASTLMNGVAFLLLALLLLTGQRGHARKRSLLLATFASALWMSVAAYQSAMQSITFLAQLFELVRDLAWIAFLARVLGAAYGDQAISDQRFRSVVMVVGAFVLLLASLTVHRFYSGLAIISSIGVDWLLGGYLLLAVFGLVMVEQLFRNPAGYAAWHQISVHGCGWPVCL